MKCNCGYTANGSRSEIESIIIRDGGTVFLEFGDVFAICPECRSRVKLEKKRG